MTDLVMVIFLTTLFAYMSEYTEDRLQQKIFYWALVITLTLFVGLRTGYNDTAAYIKSFRNAETLEVFLNDPERMHLLHNPLFYGFNSYMRELTDNYHVFFMIVAAFDSVLVIRFIRRYCRSGFAYAVFLFWGYGLGVFGLAAMKQITAMAILTWAVPALIEKRWIRFLVIVFIAGLVHTYAFLFLIMPLFVSEPWNGKTMGLVAVTGFIIFTFDSTVASLLEYADSVGKSVADFEVFDGVQMNIFRIMVFAVVPVILLIFRNRLVPVMKKEQYLLANMSIIALMFMLLARLNGANMFGRLATYFLLGDICLLGWIIDEVFDLKSRKLLITVSVVLFAGFILYDNVDFAETGGYSSISLIEFIRSLI